MVKSGGSAAAIDERGASAEPPGYRWIIAVSSVLTVTAALGFARFGYSMILPAMKEGLGLTEAQAGDLAMANMIGYLAASLLGGLLASLWGPRIVISISLAGVAAGMALTRVHEAAKAAFEEASPHAPEEFHGDWPPVLIAKAAWMASVADVDELETACRDLEEAGNTSDWSTYIEADHRFHMALVAATRNNPLIQVIGPLVSEMRAPLARAMKESYFLSTEASVQASEAIHRDILAAAKSKNAGALRRALQHHFERLRKVIEGDAEETPATVGLASGSDPAVTPSTS